jgi:ABC-type transport system involved in cytochrome c biogenesis permease subunit
MVIGLAGHVVCARTMAGAAMTKPAVARSSVRLVVVITLALVNSFCAAMHSD